VFEEGSGAAWDADVPAAVVAVVESPEWGADWEEEFSSWVRSVQPPSTTGRTRGRPGSDGVSLELVERITGARRAENRAVWRQVAAVSELVLHWRGGVNAAAGADPGACGDVDPDGDLVPASVVAEVALACGMSEYAVSRRLEAASALITESRLPRTAQALEAGSVDWAKVSMLVRETRVLTLAAANAVDALVAPMVAELNVPRLTRAVRAAVAAVDPAGHEARVREAHRGRSVGVHPGEDGMGEVNVWAPMEAVTAVALALDDAVARARAAGDPRSSGEVRCDELIARVTGRSWSRDDCTDPADPDPIDVAGSGGEGGVAASAPGVPGRGGGPVSSPRLAVTLTMTLSTWLGLRDDPATLGGEHLMPAGLARDLAVRMAAAMTHATWRCAVVDDRHTTLLGLGRPAHTDAYVPSARLAEFVRTAEPLCTFPGCGTRAHRCDLDHRVPHPDGATCAQNLQTLCRRHHRLKTAGHLSSRTSTAPDTAPGTVVWTTPTGRQYERPPTPIAPPAALIGSDVPSPPRRPPPNRSAPQPHQDQPGDPPPF